MLTITNEYSSNKNDNFCSEISVSLKMEVTLELTIEANRYKIMLLESFTNLHIVCLCMSLDIRIDMCHVSLYTLHRADMD